MTLTTGRVWDVMVPVTDESAGDDDITDDSADDHGDVVDDDGAVDD